MIKNFFQTPSVQIDTKAIKDYNDALKSGTPFEQALAQARGKTNKETLALMKSTEGLQVTTEQISKVEQASTRIGKLKSGALQAVSTVANMASFALIGAAIGGIITLVDNWIHRSERANQAMKEAVSEYESTKSRLEDLSTELDQHNQKIEELEAKGHLTYVEKGQLEELKKITRELELQKNIEEKKAERESKEVANKTVGAYKKQYDQRKISKENIETSMEYDTYVASEIANKDDVVGNITAYVKNKELLKETEDKIKKAIDAKQDISSLERDRQFYIDEIGAYESLLDSNLGDLQEKHITLEEEYQKASQKSERDRTTSDKNIIDTYKESGEVIKLIYEYRDPNTWNNMEISDIFAKEGMEGKKEELIESAKESKLTPKKIKEDQNLFKAIKESEIIGESEKEKIKEVQDQLEVIGESEIIGESEKEKIKEAQDQIKEAQDQLEAIREREIIGEREKEKIKKVQDQLEAIGESKIIGEREKEKIKEAQDQLEAIRESEIIEDDEQKKLEAFCEEINNSAQALKEMEAIANEPISISDKFEQLWSSDTFTSAREELEKLSKESGITAENIQSLATENQDFASLLEETGISADFAATCFQRVCEGADGFSSITEDALALDEVLSVMDENLAAVAAAKSEYDKAMQEEDYNAEFQDYQEAYQKGMEMFEKGEYGKHFRSTMEYLFGEDSYTMSIEEMRSAMEGLQNIFGEDSKNGLEFFDALYEKRELLEELNSSLEKQEDGTYKINLKPEELEEIAEIMGLTTEQVTACVNAYGMYGENVSYNIEDLKEALKGMSIAVEDGETSLLSLQKVQQMLSDRGYDNWTISKILQDIQQMEGVKLLDFEVSGEEELQAVLTQLQELDLVRIDGKNIHVDTLITNLRETFGLAYEDIAVFLKNLEGTYQLSDTEGKAVSVEEAIKRIQQLEIDTVAQTVDTVGESTETTSAKVDELNNKSTEPIREEFVLLGSSVDTVVRKTELLLENIERISTAKIPTPENSEEETGGKGKTKKKKQKNDSDSNTPNTSQGVRSLARFQTGTKGVPKDEIALINELGNETILDPKQGTYEVVKGGPQVRKLKKGQIILNHLQTKALFQRGKTSGFGKMQFGGTTNLKGNTYATGTNPENETIETFDFIEILLSRIQAAMEKLKTKAEEVFRSFQERDTSYKELISETQKEKDTQDKAKAEYEARANSIPLSEEWKRKVREGNVSLEDIKDENLKEQIKNYQQWHEKMLEAQKKSEELERTLVQLNMDKLQLSIDKTIGAMDKLKSQADALQSTLEDDTHKVTKKEYQNLNKNYQQQRKNLEQQNQLLEQQQTYVDQDSEEWSNLSQKIRENTASIDELERKQKENQRLTIQLEIDKAKDHLNELEKEYDKLSEKIDFKELWGGSASVKDYSELNKNSKKQMKQFIEQNKLLEEQKKQVEKGSKAWKEYEESIQSNHASIQKLTKSMAEHAIASAALAKQKAERKNEGRDKQDEKIEQKLSASFTAGSKHRLLEGKIKHIDSRQSNLKAAYQTSKKARETFGTKILHAKQKDVSKKNKAYFQEAIAKVKAGKLVPPSILNGITNALKTAEGEEYKQLSTLLSYCNYYNANKQAEEENQLNYEMYVLTAQNEKQNLRQEQLQHKLDKNQKDAEFASTSTAETAKAKNRNINIQTNLAQENEKAKQTARKQAEADRKKAAKEADFSRSKPYQKLKDKKLKKKLQQAVAAIRAGKKISKDALDAVEKYCRKYLNGDMTYFYNCEAYNEAVDHALSAMEAETLANAEAYTAKLQASREKAENTVSAREKENDFYVATAANQKTATGKNKYVGKQLKNIDKNLATYQTTYQEAKKDYHTAKKSVNHAKSKDKGKQKIIDAIKKYTSEKKAIPADLLEQAATVSEKFALSCKKYNEALEAMEVAKETYDLYEQTSQTQKASLALEKLSNIEKAYSNQQSKYTQREETIHHTMQLNQAKGNRTSTNYYQNLINNEENILESNKKKRDALVQSLAESVKNGEIEEGSDAWYEAMATIDDITTAIDASTLSLEEYNNQLRQVKWDNFDYLQDQIRSVTSELDFMISELSREELTSEKTGGLTKEGEAVAYLHAASYEANKKQAQDYAKEIQKIEQALAKDPYHQDLLERKEALTKSYQDGIKAAQEEKEAVLDLQRQGYEALSNQIKNLTSEYGELLDAQKSAFDYQKNLSDKTKEIADIRKQLEAYSNDMSEEARAKMQSLTVSLEEAEKELQETQYEKYLSDTKEMLSELGENLEEAMQEVIRSLSENFEELIEDMEKNTKDAAHVITEKMEGIGYTPTEDFQTILNGSGITVAVSAMVKAVEEFNKNMQKAADQAAKDAEPKITKEETNEAKKNPKKEETDPVRKDNKQGKNDFPKKPTYQESTEKKPEKESAVLIEIEPTKEKNKKKSTDKARGIKAKETSKKQPKDKNTTDKSRETAQISRKKDAKDKVTTDKARESIEKTTVKKAPKKKATTDKARESIEKTTTKKDVNGKDTVDKSKKISEEIEGLIKIEEPQLLAKMEAFKVLHLPSTPSHINTPLFPFPVFAPKLEGHGTNVSIEVEHIVMNGVNDPEAFTANLTDAINNNRNVRNLLVNNTVGVMAKDYNSLSGRRFAR